VAPSPADGLPPAARAAYEALRAKFRDGLPARWRDIEQAQDAGTRAAALHRLAGAAGGYGFEALGQAARAAERLAAGEPGPALEPALAELHRLLREAAGP
jgi:HPt (histidine-containing phosphotransfer) domain-containing protein